ncbi:MAG: hypothetical protein ACI9OE_002426 [Mariniflexile sp.]|jgi:hypothetical protein
MIIIRCSSLLLNEKKYILNTILNEFLGLKYKYIVDEQSTRFKLSLPEGKDLYLNATWWAKADNELLNIKSLPSAKLITNKFTPEDDIPLLFGNELIDDNDNIDCGIDIFATCFFMLSRMEEAINTEHDDHNRFPAVASNAYQNNYLERPIVDEYVEMLWNMLSYLDPTLERKISASENFITCDVDWPFDPVRLSFSKTFRTSISDLVRRKSVTSSFGRWKRYVFEQLKIKQGDSFRDSLDWIMDVNEKAGNKVAFYFITEFTSGFDSDYDFDSKAMRKLFTEINVRGHEIGLHPGYNSFDNTINFKKSAEKLRTILKEENIEQTILGGRMHYLRWDVLTTPKLWEENGFDYDSTLSFADKSGFRCGTSKEYTMFDLVERKPLKLKQRPLINMECTILDNQYENYGYSDEALNRFKYFKELTSKYNGTYTLLWHNSHFENKADKTFYKELIK